MKKNIIWWLTLCMILFCSCSPFRYQPPPIATPGSIDRIARNTSIPRVMDWRYDDRMLVYRPECNECQTAAALFSWNWHQNKLSIIPIPQFAPDRFDITQSPDPNLVAYSVNDKVHLFNLSDHQDAQVATGRMPTFSPSGNQLAFWRDQNLYVLDLYKKKEQKIYTWRLERSDDRLILSNLSWSSDGTLIAYIKEIDHSNGKGETSVAYIDINNFQEYILEKGEFNGPLSWSPDGRLLIFVRNPITDQAELVISKPSEMCVVASYPIHRQDGTAFWSPDGKSILVRYFGDMFLLNVDNVFGKPYNQLNCVK